MRPDLIARSRTGDLEAFDGLVSLWADRALQVALQASKGPEEAATAVASALATAYTQLPSLHRAHGFRTWLMSLVLKACASPPRDERLRAVLDAKGSRRLMQADRALAGLLGDAPRLRLPENFFDTKVAPLLIEPSLFASVKPLTDPKTAWRTVTSSAWICETSASKMTRGDAKPITGRGAVEKPRPSFDEIEVTFRAHGRVGWIVRSRIRFVPGIIESCYDATITPEAGMLRLRGVATPSGFLSHISEKLALESADRRTAAIERAADLTFQAR